MKIGDRGPFFFSLEVAFCLLINVVAVLLGIFFVGRKKRGEIHKRKREVPYI